MAVYCSYCGQRPARGSGEHKKWCSDECWREQRKAKDRARYRDLTTDEIAKQRQKVKDWRAKNPDKLKLFRDREREKKQSHRSPRQVAHAYRAHAKRGYRLQPCCICGDVTHREKCRPCSYEEMLRGMWERNSKGRVRTCYICGAQWCNLRSSKAKNLCSEACRRNQATAERVARRAARRAAKRKRRAWIKASSAEVIKVVVASVFERDEWKCRACGCDTPKTLRGSYDWRAPELDHIRPLSKGGDHSYSNVQLLCRACNIKKSDAPWESFINKTKTWGDHAYSAQSF